MPTTLRVTIPDNLLPKLQQRADVAQKDLEGAAALTLQIACGLLPLSGRCVVVHGAVLQRLEEILGSGSILNHEDLSQKVQRLAGITYGNIRMDFSPGQLEEIAGRAERLGLEPEELIRRTVRKMEELFFTHLGVGG